MDKGAGATPATIFSVMKLELTVCPECGAAAEVIDRFVLPSTNGPVEHAKVRCVTGRWFVLAAEPHPEISSAPDGRGLRT